MQKKKKQEGAEGERDGGREVAMAVASRHTRTLVVVDAGGGSGGGAGGGGGAASAAAAAAIVRAGLRRSEVD